MFIQRSKFLLVQDLSNENTQFREGCFAKWVVDTSIIKNLCRIAVAQKSTNYSWQSKAINGYQKG